MTEELHRQSLDFQTSLQSETTVHHTYCLHAQHYNIYRVTRLTGSHAQEIRKEHRGTYTINT